MKMCSQLKTYFFLFLALSFLSGCMNTTTVYAPVMDANGIDPMPKSGTHTVLAHETVYEIAWRYGLDYRYLAKRNHISPPYHIAVGQKIYLRGQPEKISATNTPAIKTKARQEVIIEDEPIVSEKNLAEWYWPARGSVVNKFSNNNKGINIAGRLGEPVFATGKGKVVYAGDGLRAYGNLILINHNNVYLSAYAYNQAIYVHEGEIVKKGQKIASMGTRGGAPMLHFEIRRAGKPVNPLTLLSARKSKD